MSSIISVISYYFLEGKTVNTEEEQPNKSAKTIRPFIYFALRLPTGTETGQQLECCLCAWLSN